MTEVAAPSRLAALVDFARREPGRCLAAVLVAHVVIWTALPALLSHNLQLDLAEDLALGREWQLGYWKHPPLPWWLADLAYRARGRRARRLPARAVVGRGLHVRSFGCSAATSSAAPRR